MKGHNYALPDCIKFILERMGAPDKPDFWDIAALTGDTVAQVYNRNKTNGCEYCVSGYLAGPEHIAYVFDALGCGHEYVTAAQINADKAAYLQKLMAHIDGGMPVLVKTNLNDVPGIETDVLTYLLFVGYENGGETLLFHGPYPPEGRPVELIPFHAAGEIKQDWIFPGEKTREVTLEELCLKAIQSMSRWLTLPEKDGMFFGAAAYRAWADDIEAGRYENESDLWGNYGVYVCNLATSGGEPTYLFRKLADMNPAHADLAALGEKIQALLPAETPTGGKSLLWMQLDKLGGGMDLGDVQKTMRSKKKRAKIVAALRDYAGRLDRAIALLEDYAPKEKPEIMVLARDVQDQAKEKSAIEIITKQFRLAGFEAKIDLKDSHWPGMDYVKASLKENLHKLGNLAQPPRFFDVWQADPKVNYKRTKNHSKRLFFFGAEVTSLEGIPEGFTAKDFPETTYALFKEREHGHAKFQQLEAAGLEFDTDYVEKYAMDMEIFTDAEDEGPEWDALIPIKKP